VSSCIFAKILVVSDSIPTSYLFVSSYLTMMNRLSRCAVICYVMLYNKL